MIELLKKSERIWKYLEDTHARTINELWKEFKHDMGKGKAHNAVKILVVNMENGILLLNEETFQRLNQKHRPRHSPDPEVLLL